MYSTPPGQADLLSTNLAMVQSDAIQICQQSNIIKMFDMLNFE